MIGIIKSLLQMYMEKKKPMENVGTVKMDEEKEEVLRDCSKSMD